MKGASSFCKKGGSQNAHPTENQLKNLDSS